MGRKGIKRIKEDTYLTIKEFAEIVGISESRLREYDRKGIFKPAIRGEVQNDYRYYSAMQITAAKMISVLRDSDTPLEKIAELGKQRSPDALIKLIAHNKNDIMAMIHILQERYNVANTYQNLLIEGISADESKISVCRMPEIPITLGEPAEFKEGESFFNAFIEFNMTLRNPKMNPLYPVGGYFDNFDAFLEHPSEPSRFFSFDPDGHGRRESGLYLVGYTRGYYGVTKDLPKRMADYAEENMIRFNGPVYHTYLFDELSTPDPDNYLLQVAASIKSSAYKTSHHIRSTII